MTTPPPGHVPDIPQPPGAPEVAAHLQAITHRLDDTQDLLEGAVQHLTTLEERLRRHDYAIHDLHWDAAKILTSDNPDAADTPVGRRTLHAVQDGSDHLVQDLRVSAAAATTSHTLLTGADRQLRHAQHLLGELGQIGGPDQPRQPGSPPGPGTEAVEFAVLASRTERLATLVEAAMPLAERAQQQLGQAQEILQRQVSAGTSPGSPSSADRFQRFWAVDVGIFDSSHAVAQARTTTRDGTELLERAVHTGTLTAAQARTALRQHTPLPHQPPPPSRGPAAPAGPSI